MLRSLPAVLIASVALLGAPAAATVITISAATAASAESGDSAVSAVDEISPALWVWGGTGLVGVAAMVAFGSTIVRRGARPETVVTDSAVSVEVPADASVARFA